MAYTLASTDGIRRVGKSKVIIISQTITPSFPADPRLALQGQARRCLFRKMWEGCGRGTSRASTGRKGGAARRQGSQGGLASSPEMDPLLWRK